MTCYKPLQAYRTHEGKIIFNPSNRAGDPNNDGHPLKLPCGQCIGCRADRAKQWAVRCAYESQLHEHNCFVTLTYDPEHLPADGSLNYEHYQLFMKRLRKRFGSQIRFYMCGEYGENFARPHFHALLFNFYPPDAELIKSGKNPLYTSQILSEIWGKGYVSFGALTLESAAYVARYVMKKITGKQSDKHYSHVDLDTGELIKRTPEFNKMSLKPGIGADWFNQFKDDVYPNDYVVINGKKLRTPKYFDKLLEKLDSELLEEIKSSRLGAVSKHLPNNTPERLRVRLKVAEASQATFSRTYEKG